MNQRILIPVIIGATILAWTLNSNLNACKQEHENTKARLYYANQQIKEARSYAFSSYQEMSEVLSNLAEK